MSIQMTLIYLLSIWLCMSMLDVRGEVCEKKPRFSPALKAQLRKFIAPWINIRGKPANLTSEQIAYIRRLDLKPVPNRYGYGYRYGYGHQQLRTRREYRQMTTTQRNDFHDALKAMMNTFIGGVSQYHIFVRYHNPNNAPSAHGGAGFLPWHREYLFRFENALREHRPYAFLPYWDTRLERYLPTPKDSVMWRNSLMGDNDGPVTTGTFANWPVTDECDSGGNGILRRSAGGSPEALFMDSDVETILSLNSFEELHGSIFEGVHGAVHNWLGGQMRSIQCSPSEPCFWLHHAFIDCIWETFRQVSQTTPLTEYTDAGIPGSRPQHLPDAIMKPFDPLLNRDGVRTSYTRYFYKCAPPPNCCSKHSDCGNTRHLWCHRGRCKSKVRAGGDCTGLPDVACFSLYKCFNNKCGIPI